MPILQVKGSSSTGYVAGIGASGALLASTFALFVILIGLVTFSTWPHAGGLLGDGGGDVALDGTAAQEPVRGAVQRTAPNLVKLLGRPGPVTRTRAVAESGRTPAD